MSTPFRPPFLILAGVPQSVQYMKLGKQTEVPRLQGWPLTDISPSALTLPTPATTSAGSSQPRAATWDGQPLSAGVELSRGVVAHTSDRRCCRRRAAAFRVQTTPEAQTLKSLQHGHGCGLTGTALTGVGVGNLPTRNAQQLLSLLGPDRDQ